ncbi:MarC family protein [Telmatospirillum sp.]|uniref:MarC family protein n=1 Tax=Telmatospirillum sp. TaxID=2079197 RepID=UPI00284AC3E2|nr:MarC family protein [Telmatospirillum sp.]MDR3439237.1 MarC family protein [Telmatospirillum sp.]
MKTLFYNFVTFFVVIDPVGCAAVFAAMTPSIAAAQRNVMARKATLLAGLILFVFAFLGEGLLSALGIGLAAFRIAGGLMLLLLAIEMVFARPRRVTRDEDQEAEHRQDITVFPLAFPLIAGPGAMTTVVLLIGRQAGQPTQVIGVLAVLALVLALVLICLMAAGKVYRVLGVTGSNVISRILGIILAALAVQFIIDGIVEALHGAGH